MKLFKTTDEKFMELGFTKVKEDKYGALYTREVVISETNKYTQEIDLLHKENGNHLIQSYQVGGNSDGFDNMVGLTMYEAKLCLKKMKEMGWK